MKKIFTKKGSWISRLTGEAETEPSKIFSNKIENFFKKIVSKIEVWPIFARPILIKNIDTVLVELDMTLAQYSRLKAITSLIGFAIGLVILLASSQGIFSFFVLFVLVFTLVGFILPDVFLKDRITQRNMQLEMEFPYFLDLLYLYTGSEAFDNIGVAITETSQHMQGLIGEDLRKLCSLYRFVDRETFLDKLDEKFSNQSERDLTTTLRLTLKYGGNISEKIGILTREAYKNRIQRAKETGQQLTVALMFSLMIFHFPVAVALLLAPTLLSIKGPLLGL